MRLHSSLLTECEVCLRIRSGEVMNSWLFVFTTRIFRFWIFTPRNKCIVWDSVVSTKAVPFMSLPAFSCLSRHVHGKSMARLLIGWASVDAWGAQSHLHYALHIIVVICFGSSHIQPVNMLNMTGAEAHNNNEWILKIVAWYLFEVFRVQQQSNVMQWKFLRNCIQNDAFPDS